MFNALKYTEELKKAGFSSDQAEVSVRLLIDAMNENFATKSDMKELEVALRSDVTGLRSEMKELGADLRSEIKALNSKVDSFTHRFESALREVEYKLTIKLGSVVVIVIGAMATLLKIFQH